jgi:hypothetical protein
MVTLATLLNTIISKAGFMRLVENRDQAIGASDRSKVYLIVYRKSGMVTIETAKIYVTDFGQATESAEWLGCPPAFVSPPAPTEFETALAARIATAMANNTKIKRAVITEIDIINTFAIVAAYVADAATPTKITKTMYYAYSDSGVISFYPYAAA